jgi:hypothetical protein
MLKLVMVFLAIAGGTQEPVPFTKGVSIETYSTVEECYAAAKPKIDKITPKLIELLAQATPPANLYGVAVSCEPADKAPSPNVPVPTLPRPKGEQI